MTGFTLDPDFPALGFDPAPGNPGNVDALVMQLTSSARHLEAAHQTLRRVTGGGTDWQGDAARGFSARVAPLPAQLDAARRSFEEAARQLDGWRADLDGMQSKARAYEHEAEQAHARMKRAEDNPDLDLAGHVFDNDADLAAAQSRLDAANRELEAASQALGEIRAQAMDLAGQHKDLADRCAAAIRRAAEGAPDGPGLFDRLADGIKDLVTLQLRMARSVADFVKNHANAIAAVGDMLSTASTLVGVVGTAIDLVGCAFPPVEPVGLMLNATSGVLGLGALGFHAAAKAGGADVSGSTLAQDTFGALSFGFGDGIAVAGRVGMAAPRVVRAAAQGELVTGGTGFLLNTMSLKDMVGDPHTLGYFQPKGKRQHDEYAVTTVLGSPLAGGLLVGFQNAWHDGSKKDAAAADQRGK
ncbi:hypothetical protein LO771_11505 [Streptacidiphilus sp. ASG 303]|uniref:putative T7SS-secreted protein n=1 Tax=Streptacidiphilus sp. ASG 303 TaxID=2896847 RepID=UPI001E5A4CEF|nr:hypothetical protein [Streptacidiphilus sp. ASG 303]MCD0483009.1 hypothetical protein [Streptacidiphilus sp. ASG 303]